MPPVKPPPPLHPAAQKAQGTNERHASQSGCGPGCEEAAQLVGKENEQLRLELARMEQRNAELVADVENLRMRNECLVRGEQNAVGELNRLKQSINQVYEQYAGLEMRFNENLKVIEMYKQA